MTPGPVAQEVEIDGVPATRVRPGSGSSWPAAVLVNGATELGRHHPGVRRLAEALARAGHLVLVPDPPGLARAEISEEGLAGLVSVSTASGGRVALFGISVGTTLALLAAEEPALAGRVSVVAGLAPYTDLADLIRLATTGTYREGSELRSYPAGSFLALSVGRSVAADLEPGRDRDRLVAALRDVEIGDPDPLAPLRELDLLALGPAGRAAVELLLNRDPARFDELYAALPDSMRAAVDRLSPIAGADRLRCPVELFSHPHDKYFPLEHSRRLVQAVPGARLTVVSVLAHADARLSLRALRDLWRLAGVVARSLRYARFG